MARLDLPGLQAQVAQLVDDGRVVLVQFQDLLVERDGLVPVPLFPGLIGFLLQIG